MVSSVVCTILNSKAEAIGEQTRIETASTCLLLLHLTNQELFRLASLERNLARANSAKKSVLYISQAGDQ